MYYLEYRDKNSDSDYWSRDLDGKGFVSMNDLLQAIALDIRQEYKSETAFRGWQDLEYRVLKIEVL